MGGHHPITTIKTSISCKLHCGRASPYHHNSNKHFMQATLWAGITLSPQFKQAFHANYIVGGHHPITTIQISNSCKLYCGRASPHHHNSTTHNANNIVDIDISSKNSKYSLGGQMLPQTYNIDISFLVSKYVIGGHEPPKHTTWKFLFQNRIYFIGGHKLPQTYNIDISFLVSKYAIGGHEPPKHTTWKFLFQNRIYFIGGQNPNRHTTLNFQFQTCYIRTFIQKYSLLLAGTPPTRT